MKKVIFHIFGKSPELTTHIMSKIWSKYKYIRVYCEDSKCIIASNQISGSLNSWLIERLVSSKRFLGKFHMNHPAYNAERVEKISDKYQTCISRFGFWTSGDYPEESHQLNYDIYKTALRLKGVPSYKAVILAQNATSYNPPIPDNLKPLVRRLYIHELVKYYGHNQAIATRKVDRYFKSFDIPEPPKEPIDKELVRQNTIKANQKLMDMIATLKFLGCPKARAKWLKRNDDFIGSLFLTFMLQKHGRDWFLENVGEVEGIT
jgi:hypothetical protein